MFLLLLLPALAFAASADRRIVGGSGVDIGNFPFQGSYRTDTGSHSCGCVLVGSTWVLTAGHCGGTSAYTMQFGSSTRSGGGVIVAVDSVLRHPDYDVGPGFTPNDISVVTAASAISGENIAAGEIAQNADNPETEGWITGWGRTCGNCGLPDTLQGVEINIISDTLCAEMHESSFDASNMICVWNEVDEDTGACNGDSGGPLSVGNTIYGLTSWGRSGCLTTFPSVYNRVGAFRDWICDSTGRGASGC